MNSRFRFRTWDKLRRCYKAPVDYAIVYDIGKTIGVGFCVKNSIAEVDKEQFMNKDDYIIEQCTGQKDCNYEPIYEGDIVDILYLNFKIRHKGVVRWDGFEFVIEDRFGMLLALRSVFRNRSKVDIKVLGNIHENPELLANYNERK